jgi:hypothetical protein
MRLSPMFTRASFLIQEVKSDKNREKTMTIREAIHKATETGYHINGSDGMETSYEGASNEYSPWTRKDNASTFVITVEETFLDPAFWQALGRALESYQGLDKRCLAYDQRWIQLWHRFIDHLAQGRSHATFFENL